MSNTRVSNLPPLVIPNGGTDSNALAAKDYGDAVEITIYSPATITGTITVQVSPNDPPSTTGFVTLQSPPGTDIAVAASKAITIVAYSYKQLRIHSSGAEAAERTFPATKGWRSA